MKRLSMLAGVMSMAMCSMALAQAAPAKAPDKAPDKAPAVPAKVTDKAKEAAKDAGDKAKDSAKGAADNAKDAMKAMDEAWAKSAEVGPNHKMLEAFAGHWNAKMTEYNPDGTSKETEGKLSSEMVMGGRYVQMDYAGRNSKGQFMRGMGLMGYCNTNKQFEHLWIDSMTTHMDTMVGQADAAGKVITLKGDMPNPMGGGSMKTRQVVTVNSKDNYSMAYYADMGGKEMKLMDVVFTRTDAPDAKSDAKGK